MLISIILLILGFIILIKGSDMFVDGSSSLATNFKLPKIIIGLTIVAFGTSAPELAVSISALLSNSGEIVLGNVVGSNIFNVLGILGIASVICPLRVKNDTAKKEIPICLLISTVLAVLLCDSYFDLGLANRISRSDAIVILLFFLIFIYYLITTAKNKIKEEIDEKPKYSLKKSFFFAVIGILALIVGSDLIVDNAIIIASKLGVSERFIALTIVATGTSLPELVTTITAALKKEHDIIIGNLVGSNIFNICIVLGIPVALLGSITPTTFSMFDLVMLLVSSVMLFVFARTNYKISKREGILMLLTFIVYYTYIIIQGVVL